MDSTDKCMNLARAIIVKSLNLISPYPEKLEIYKVPQWDSFGQLQVILGLERELGVRITDEAVFETLTSQECIANFINSTISGDGR